MIQAAFLSGKAQAHLCGVIKIDRKQTDNIRALKHLTGGKK